MAAAVGISPQSFQVTKDGKVMFAATCPAEWLIPMPEILVTRTNSGLENTHMGRILQMVHYWHSQFITPLRLQYNTTELLNERTLTNMSTIISNSTWQELTYHLKVFANLCRQVREWVTYRCVNLTRCAYVRQSNYFGGACACAQQRESTQVCVCIYLDMRIVLKQVSVGGEEREQQLRHMQAPAEDCVCACVCVQKHQTRYRSWVQMRE